MSSKPNKEAFAFLHEEAFPNVEKIKAMSPDQVTEHLAGMGSDMDKLKAHIEGRRKVLTGKLTLLAARKRRMEKREDVAAAETPKTIEGIIEAINSQFGEEWPLAAQKAVGKMNLAELTYLYQDLMGGAKKPSDGV